MRWKDITEDRNSFGDKSAKIGFDFRNHDLDFDTRQGGNAVTVATGSTYKKGRINKPPQSPERIAFRKQLEEYCRTFPKESSIRKVLYSLATSMHSDIEGNIETVINQRLSQLKSDMILYIPMILNHIEKATGIKINFVPKKQSDGGRKR